MTAFVRHTASFVVTRPVEEVFPLFSPEGERLWVPDWEYENLMGTTELSEGYVFLTANHDHASGQAVWIVKRYDPSAHKVEFYKVEPGVKVGQVIIRCREHVDGTEVAVTYEYRALSERGREFVEGFTEEVYRAFIGEWKELLERYLEDSLRD